MAVAKPVTVANSGANDGEGIKNIAIGGANGVDGVNYNICLPNKKLHFFCCFCFFAIFLCRTGEALEANLS